MDSTKPEGSAYISIQVSLGASPKLVDTDICVDTGADYSICDNKYLLAHFGITALENLFFPERIPKMRSATGHELMMLGKINLTLHMGEYQMELDVLVHHGTIGMFLLGNDAFYNRLVYDQGKYLSFADNKYPPIPIKYE